MWWVLGGARALVWISVSMRLGTWGLVRNADDTEGIKDIAEERKESRHDHEGRLRAPDPERLRDETCVTACVTAKSNVHERKIGLCPPPPDYDYDSTVLYPDSPACPRRRPHDHTGRVSAYGQR
eukprot:1358963-Prymnesium_polylepis.1